MLWCLVALVILLALAAFFAGAEAALFSLTPGRREELRAAHVRSSRRIESLLGRPDRLLGTLLLGNLVVSATASALATVVLISMAHRSGRSEVLYLGVGGFALTAILLVFGEVIPKVIATRRPAKLARLVARPVSLVELALAPLVALLLRVSARFTPRRPDPPGLSDEELRTMIEIGKERKVIHGNEEEILMNLVDLDRRTVSEVMTPRIDIVALPDDASVREAIAACRSARLSRLPVYHSTIDRITGTAYAKELLTAPDDKAPVSSLARAPYFVPEVKKLPELLDELRRRGSHIAVVVDEFGQTAGLVTLEDLLEAVFGEITDEFDVTEELPYCKLDESSYLVDGEIDIATLNRLFRGGFGRLGHERLASFIHERLGRLPEPGDAITHGGLEITVQQVAGNTLEKVLVRRTG